MIEKLINDTLQRLDDIRTEETKDECAHLYRALYAVQKLLQKPEDRELVIDSEITHTKILEKRYVFAFCTDEGEEANSTCYWDVKAGLLLNMWDLPREEHDALMKRIREK